MTDILGKEMVEIDDQIYRYSQVGLPGKSYKGTQESLESMLREHETRDLGSHSARNGILGEFLSEYWL